MVFHTSVITVHFATKAIRSVLQDWCIRFWICTSEPNWLCIHTNVDVKTCLCGTRHPDPGIQPDPKIQERNPATRVDVNVLFVKTCWSLQLCRSVVFWLKKNSSKWVHLPQGSGEHSKQYSTYLNFKFHHFFMQKKNDLYHFLAIRLQCSIPRFCQFSIFASILLEVPKFSKVPRTCWLSPLSATVSQILVGKEKIWHTTLSSSGHTKIDSWPIEWGNLHTKKRKSFFSRKRATWVDYMTVFTRLATIIGLTTQQNQL